MMMDVDEMEWFKQTYKEMRKRWFECLVRMIDDVEYCFMEDEGYTPIKKVMSELKNVENGQVRGSCESRVRTPG